LNGSDADENGDSVPMDDRHEVARSRAKTVGQRVTFSEVLKQQFKTQKELYVTPTIAVISVLPQVILTFSFACTPLSDWQRHT
ncbi:unnamed protein product, partial [Rotaria magnacalcarata]